MNIKHNLQKRGGGGVRRVTATALALLLLLFLLPLLLFGEPGDGAEAPAATGSLPIDRTVVTPGVTADSQLSVRVH